MRLVQSKSKIWLRRLFCLLCSLVLVLTAGVSSAFVAEAKSRSELESEKSKIQSRINSTQSKLNSLSKQKKDTQEYINTLQEKISLLQDKISNLESDKTALQSEIDATQAKIEKTAADIEETQRQIDQKQKEFDATYAEYCQRLRAMYISGSASTLEVLLTCSDLSSLLTRSEMIKSVSQQDSATLDSLMKKMEEIKAQKQKLEEKRNQLNADKKSLETDKAALQKNINDISSTKADLDSEAAECNAQMRKLSKQSSEYQEAIETDQKQLQQVQNDISAAIAAAGSHGSGSISGSHGSGNGRLRYPTDSRSISAGYPNYSSGRYHGGIDFPVSTGSNVYAAASGTVILVKYLNYSYGRYLIIDHGDGLSTLYAHNSQILVNVGDKVSAGQVVAKSGSTGNSTGPHCHFEVRVNGSRVNPLNYL